MADIRIKKIFAARVIKPRKQFVSKLDAINSTVLDYFRIYFHAGMKKNYCETWNSFPDDEHFFFHAACM